MSLGGREGRRGRVFGFFSRTPRTSVDPAPPPRQPPCPAPLGDTQIAGTQPQSTVSTSTTPHRPASPTPPPECPRPPDVHPGHLRPEPLTPRGVLVHLRHKQGFCRTSSPSEHRCRCAHTATFQRARLQSDHVTSWPEALRSPVLPHRPL